MAIILTLLVLLGFCASGYESRTPVSGQPEYRVYYYALQYKTNTVLDPEVSITSYPFVAIASAYQVELSETNLPPGATLVVSGARAKIKEANGTAHQFVLPQITNLTGISATSSNSLAYAVLTNCQTQLTGKATQLFTTNAHISGWPDVAPALEWSASGAAYGWTGYSAVSPCNEFELSHGQVKVTAITRRHGYFRGHGSSPTNGYTTHFQGKRVFFLGTNNVVHTAVITNSFHNFGGAYLGGMDASVCMFVSELPAEVDIMPVVLSTGYDTSAAAVAAFYCDTTKPVHLMARSEFLLPYFFWDQFGHCGTGTDGLERPWAVAGNSGGPFAVPMPNRTLAMYGGASTSIDTMHIQAACDWLCDTNGVSHYSMTAVDLTSWPTQ